MPINTKYLDSFQEKEFMHVVCRAVGFDVLFRNEENKIYFLTQYRFYLSAYVDTYCYCLLDNHVHWLIRCKSENELSSHLQSISCIERKGHQRAFIEKKISFEQAVEFQFKDFFISYAKAYNRRFNRLGTLFINPFRRISIKGEQHLIRLIVYIHANAVKHRLVGKISDYSFSSYNEIISAPETWLERRGLFEWFGGRLPFIETHLEAVSYYSMNKFGLE